MPKGRSVGPPLAIQVDPIELIHHDAAFTCTTHLHRDQPSFAEQLPQAPTRKPEEEFALLNLLAKMFETMNKADPNNPEGVVLRAMAKNFVTPETKQALDTGAPLQPQKPNEFKTAEFAQAMKALAQKYKNDPPKRDAVMCIAAAAHGRPLTAEDVFLVFQNLAEGVQLTPEQWLQILQLLVQAATGMKKEVAKDWQRQMAAQRNPNAMDLANLLQRDLDVRPDGTIAPRHAPIPTVQKGEDTMGLLKMSRDFWMALFKAHQDKKIRDEMEHDIAQLLKNVGQKYVRAGRTEDPVAMDAKANRHLIRKLRENPMIQADEAKMAALDKLAKAETTGRSPTPKELVEIFEALGKGVPMTPGMLKIILEYLTANMRGAKQAEDLAPVQKVLKSGDKIDPVEAIRAMNTAFVRKPDESAAIVELFANVFLAMAATKQNAALRENHQRMLADALHDVAKAHGPGGQLDNDAYRMKLMRLRANPHVAADPTKKRAVEELVAAEATGKRLAQPQLQEVFRDLSKGLPMTLEMLRAILEFMCIKMRALSQNEKVELQLRFKQQPPLDPVDVVDEAHRVRQEQKEATSGAKLVGCFQILPDNHPAIQQRIVAVSESKEVGMRAGPASVEWHRYKAVGLQPPEEEMARIVLVQHQLGDSNFGDEKTQKTLLQEASTADVSFRSILQPSVMEKYKESMSVRGNSQAVSVLQSMSQVGVMDDRQLGKKVDQLLATMNIDGVKLQNVLQQLVKDRLMTNDEAKDVQRQCELLMASGGGRMKLSDLQGMMKGKRAHGMDVGK